MNQRNMPPAVRRRRGNASARVLRWEADALAFRFRDPSRYAHYLARIAELHADEAAAANEVVQRDRRRTHRMMWGSVVCFTYLCAEAAWALYGQVTG